MFRGSRMVADRSHVPCRAGRECRGALQIAGGREGTLRVRSHKTTGFRGLARPRARNPWRRPAERRMGMNRSIVRTASPIAAVVVLGALLASACSRAGSGQRDPCIDAQRLDCRGAKRGPAVSGSIRQPELDGCPPDVDKSEREGGLAGAGPHRARRNPDHRADPQQDGVQGLSRRELQRRKPREGPLCRSHRRRGSDAFPWIDFDGLGFARWRACRPAGRPTTTCRMSIRPSSGWRSASFSTPIATASPTCDTGWTTCPSMDGETETRVGRTAHGGRTSTPG